MARDLTELFSVALGYLGQPAIVSASETTKPAATCQRFWPSARDLVLRRHPWKCVLERQELTQSPTAPVFGGDFYYVLPDDVLRVWHMDGAEYEDVNWRVERGMILTNYTPCKVSLVMKSDDVWRWDSILFDAAATYLAHMACMVLTGSASISKAIFDLYLLKIIEAESVDAMEQSPDKIESNNWLGSRL